MNWVLEHLQILIAIAAAVAYFINRARGGTEEGGAGESPTRSAVPAENEQAERTRRVQAEIRRKIAERRGAVSTQTPLPVGRESIPPLVRPAQTPPIDPFGGPMRKILRDLEEAAEKRLQPQPDPEEVARAAVLERQRRLAAEVRALEAERLEEARRAMEVVAKAAPAVVNAQTTRSARSVGDSLRDPRELRRAIVLREILSVPVALR